MSLHIKSPGDAPGIYPMARRGSEMRHLSFTVMQLGAGLPEHTFESDEEELALAFYTGAVRVDVDGWQAEVPPRPSIREPGAMVYVPAGCRIRLAMLEDSARITAAGALGKPGGKPALIQPEDVPVQRVGKDNWVRTVATHIAGNVDAARLITGETVNQPGGWSSCPPHRHDRFSGPEVPMDEIYYFQFEPKQGFGFLRVYSDPDDPEPFDHAYPVEHGDAVLIPRGYHPLVTCPGYWLGFTWVLAGAGRQYGAWTEDPRHVWIKS